jgi:serine/threonine protein kinase
MNLGTVIGSGATGQVFRGAYEGVAVAIKRITIPLQFNGSMEPTIKPADEGMLEEVRREAEVLSKIQHPLLLRFYGVCVTQRDIYFVTELMWGSLNDVICGRRESPTQSLPPTLFLKTIRDIARGMAYLHARGFVHRDLKPANILCDESLLWAEDEQDCLIYGSISEFGGIKIADFGCAVSDVDRRGVSMTSNMGTPAYMAPELVADSRRTSSKVNSKVDVYSFAILVWALFTRQRPYSNIKSLNLFTMMNLIVEGLRPHMIISSR